MTIEWRCLALLVLRYVVTTQVIKHDRKGRSRLRELYSSDGGVSFSWREPSKRGHEKKLSSGGRNRVDYAFDQVMEVRSYFPH